MKIDPIDLYVLTTQEGRIVATGWMKRSEVELRCSTYKMLFAKVPHRQQRGRHRRFGMSRRQRLALKLD